MGVFSSTPRTFNSVSSTITADTLVPGSTFSHRLRCCFSSLPLCSCNNSLKLASIFLPTSSPSSLSASRILFDTSIWLGEGKPVALKSTTPAVLYFSLLGFHRSKHGYIQWLLRCLLEARIDKFYLFCMPLPLMGKSSSLDCLLVALLCRSNREWHVVIEF